MSLGASLVLLAIVGVVIVFDLLSIVKRFDEQLEDASDKTNEKLVK